MNKTRVTYLDNEELDHFEAEYSGFRNDVVVEYHGKRYIVSVYSFSLLYKDICSCFKRWGYSYQVPPNLIILKKVTCAEIERVVERLAEVGYFETMCTQEEYVNTRNSSLKWPVISYVEDTPKKTDIAKREGYRDDVIVSLENSKYQVTLVTPERLKNDFEKAWDRDGFFIPYHNQLVLKEVTKKEAEIVINIGHLEYRIFNVFMPLKERELYDRIEESIVG